MKLFELNEAKRTLSVDQIAELGHTFGKEIAKKSDDEQYDLIKAKMKELGITNPDQQDVFTDQAFMGALQINDPKEAISRIHSSASDWFDNQDLGPLEDVREYVFMHAWENAADVPIDEIEGVFKSTVQMYVDDPKAANEVFDDYRKKQ